MGMIHCEGAATGFVEASKPIMPISPYKTSYFCCINNCCKTKHSYVATNTMRSMK